MNTKRKNSAAALNKTRFVAGQAVIGESFRVRNKLVWVSIVSFAAATVFFAIFPEADILISKLFFKTDHFLYKHNHLVRFFYIITPIFTKLFAACCAGFLLLKLYFGEQRKAIIKSNLAYLLCSAIIGPGLIVNSILKETVGRARPSQITEFGGQKSFTSVLSIADQCHHNCSFASGHAAMGFYFTALAYAYSIGLLRQNQSQNFTPKYFLQSLSFSKIYLLTLFFGLLVGASRVIMGGHFTSDVTAAGFIALLVNHILYNIWQRG